MTELLLATGGTTAPPRPVRVLATDPAAVRQRPSRPAKGPDQLKTLRGEINRATALFVQLPANTGLVGFSAHFCRASSLSKAALIMSLNPAGAPPCRLFRHAPDGLLQGGALNCGYTNVPTDVPRMSGHVPGRIRVQPVSTLLP